MMAVYRMPSPSLITLGIISFILATKLVTSRTPIFSEYVQMVNSWGVMKIDKEDLLSLEKKVLIMLDFNLCYEAPTNFLDRFDIIFGVLSRKTSWAQEY